MTNSVTDRLVQILPFRILCFDQLDLPAPLPFLEFFLAGNRGDRVVVDFEPDKPCDIVPGSEAGSSLRSMLVDATHYVIGHPKIDCSIPPTRDDINVVTHGCCKLPHLNQSF